LSGCGGSHGAIPPTPEIGIVPDELTTQSLAPIIAHQAIAAHTFGNAIGINTHFGFCGTAYDSAQAESALIALGVKHIRDSGPNSCTVRHLQHLFPYGIKVDVEWPLQYFQGPASGWNPTPATLASTLGASNIDAYEGANEPNGLGLANWAALTRTEQSALYGATQPLGMPVIAPSIAYYGDYSQYLAAAQSLGSVPANYGNIHSYAAGNQIPEAMTPTIPQWEAGTINAPVQVTEFGYDSAGKCIPNSGGATAQAEYIPRTLLSNYLAGVRSSYVFELLDADGCDFGLMTSGYVAKPAYNELRGFMSVIADASPSTPGKLAYGVSSGLDTVLLRNAAGIWYLILWRPVPWSVAPTTATVQFYSREVRSAQTFNASGDLINVALSTTGNTITLPVGPQVVIVEIK
jgi:hypothetical protein